ncbi:MAG: sugar ABC transporter ATP-binding protein [Mycobacterium sp.]
MRDAPTILRMCSIGKSFGPVRALHEVNLTVTAGQVHAICGENGAGKSTLVRVLSGVYPHGTYDGDVYFHDELQQFRNVNDSEQRGLVIIHQELALIPEMSILDNLFLGNQPRKRAGSIDWEAAYRSARDLLTRVGLDEDPDLAVKHLGVGKQQLVEIARALSKSPQLLILDEPTAALNEAESQNMLGLIRSLQSQDISSILISHKLEEIAQVADAITVLRDGRSIETIDLRDTPMDEDRIIQAMVGRSLEQRFPERDTDIGEELLRVEGWTVRHPLASERLVCKGSAFSVRRGEIVGFAGLMGAGRTELAMSLFGRSYGAFVSGTVYKSGREIVIRNVPEAISAGLAYLSEDRKALGLNLLDEVKRSVVSAKPKRIARRGVIDSDRERAVAEDYRARLNIKTPSVDAGVATLSGGNQQKVVLAKWMFTDPDVLILDEPTRGIDVGAKYDIYLIIQGLAAQGKAVVVISSELPELLGITDRIYTLFEGQVTGEVATADATPESLIRGMTSNRNGRQ